MARSRYTISEARAPHFLTCTVVNWLPLFSNPALVEILLDSWRFLHDQGRLTLYAYVIMENHLHLVGAAENLGKEIGDFKSFTARKMIDRLRERKADWILQQLALYKAGFKTDRQYQLWQEGAHPQQIQDETMMRQKVEYIHNNPVKRGYVDDPLHWRYSSARNYAGLPGLVEVCRVW
ncbi:transposase [Desulfobulbus rhabdoformis]|uniref:REP-associated tyrosine transposase n=1 Tax=Desulfobulbus rhabdoformis TaxID=34032 RepID=UPI00196524D0|nr:transposase [Desulfobulbus rhabdoformis]MBM9613088.1 transposase [Desulfobulbus rhabdoformis]